MSYSSKDIKALLKNAIEMIGKEEITAAMIPSHSGKPEMLLVKGEVFHDLKGEYDAMKFWIHTMAGQIYGYADNPDKKTAYDHLQMMCTDAMTRFLNPGEAELKEAMKEFTDGQ